MSENPSGVSPESGSSGQNPGLTNNSAQGGSSGFNPLYLIPPAIGAIGSYLGGKSANDANSAEGAANRDFAAREAETARQYDQAKTSWQATHGYQNAVTDMTKAGLNPALMYSKGQGGMESGSGGGGSQASAAGNPIHTNAIGQGLASAGQAFDTVNNIRNANADITLKGTQAATQLATAKREVSSAQQLDQQSANLARQSKLLDATFKASSDEANTRSNKAKIDRENESTRQLLGLINQGTSSAKDLTGGFTDIMSGLNPIGKALKGLTGSTTTKNGGLLEGARQNEIKEGISRRGKGFNGY